LTLDSTSYHNARAYQGLDPVATDEQRERGISHALRRLGHQGYSLLRVGFKDAGGDRDEGIVGQLVLNLNAIGSHIGQEWMGNVVAWYEFEHLKDDSRAEDLFHRGGLDVRINNHVSFGLNGFYVQRANQRNRGAGAELSLKF